MTAKAPLEKHSTEIVKLAGKDIRVTRVKVPLDLIDLDPENPRTGYFADTKKAATGLSQTQAELEFALRYKAEDAYEKLRESIETNQGLTNPIWLSPTNNGRYRVIEGNSRLLAYRDLHKKFLGDKTYVAIPSRVLPAEIDPLVQDFIRIEAHLRGVNPWEAYERARFLYHMFHEKGMTYRQLATMTRLTEKEAEASTEAYRTMTERYLSVYKDPNEVQKFSYFAEYHSKKSIREAISRNAWRCCATLPHWRHGRRS